jgi:hypothetical protein
MLCRCKRRCYRRGKYWKVGEEYEFGSCPPSFEPVAAAIAIAEQLPPKEIQADKEPEEPMEIPDDLPAEAAPEKPKRKRKKKE